VTEIIFEPEAEADVLNAFAWYENQRRGLGLLFRGALDAALERIEREPLAFPVQYRALRRVLVDRFPYAIYFRAYPTVVTVVAVVHGRRDPNAWQQRR
jgi:plasmid stabilization system protein ParE